MRFFLAVSIFVLFTQIYFWGLVFLFGAPRIYKVQEIVSNPPEYAEKLNVDRELALKEFRKGENGEEFIIANSNGKVGSIVLLVSMFAFLCIFIAVILFYKKSYVSFPVITSIVVASSLHMLLWSFAESIPKTLLLDITKIKDEFHGLSTIRLIGPYLALFFIILIFSEWYRLNER